MLNINQILFLKKHNITTLNQIAIIQFCTKERSFGEVSKDLSVSVRGIERFCESHYNSGLIEVTNLKQIDLGVKKGRPVTRGLKTTAKAKRILKKLETIV